MATAEVENLQTYCREVAENAKRASRELAGISGGVIRDWLRHSANLIRVNRESILSANAQDLENAPGYGLKDAEIDRLHLNPKRLEEIALALEEVALLPSPVGEVLDSSRRPNGLDVQKIRVPLGVVFFIFESRPNVTSDAAALCVKSGNAVILRGGKEAFHSNQAIVSLLSQAAKESGIPEHAVQLVSTTDREAVGHFLKMNDLIDLTIPRGGESLIRRVAAEATMPVIKHFSGNCHVYIDEGADLEMAEKITINAKTQRMGVCNAAESLVVHVKIASKFLPALAKKFDELGVELRGDSRVCALVKSAKPATKDDYFTEFHGPVMSAVIVDSIEDAIKHINHYSSGHTEAIVTKDISRARKFTVEVDSSAVIVNASTRFNDGGQFGLGAEIGISTDKFHARGPCGLRELTSYKYVVFGEGQIRE
ncbi:Gamma-glutamyl phosphate reductase [Planctomycetales bacterium 10988]|nr:Gamma-glutamyl phosphate reductase [Planctomycetales bacterium 10988]